MILSFSAFLNNFAEKTDVSIGDIFYQIQRKDVLCQSLLLTPSLKLDQDDLRAQFLHSRVVTARETGQERGAP